MLILYTQLPKLSTAGDESNNPGVVGYAIPWCSDNDLYIYIDYDIKVISIFLVVTSKFIIIFFCYELFHLLHKHRIHRKTHDWYHAYWAFQLTLIVGLVLLIKFVNNNQKNQHAITLFTASLCVDGGLSAFAIVIMIILEAKAKHSIAKDSLADSSQNHLQIQIINSIAVTVTSHHILLKRLRKQQK